jgi:hypothetical protein
LQVTLCHWSCNVDDSSFFLQRATWSRLFTVHWRAGSLNGLQHLMYPLRTQHLADSEFRKPGTRAFRARHSHCAPVAADNESDWCWTPPCKKTMTDFVVCSRSAACRSSGVHGQSAVEILGRTRTEIALRRRVSHRRQCRDPRRALCSRHGASAQSRNPV